MIYALPGMGADQRMYPGPWLEIPDFVPCAWASYKGERTLLELARTVCDAQGVRDGDTLVGCSLGGMVACEITKIRNIPRLYLIGSATHPSEISGLLSLLHPLARVAPIDWLKWSAARIPTELMQMFADVEPAFMRAMCSAVFTWEGLGVSHTEISRIHGRQDLVIPPPPRADLLLGGGHLISMTHAQQCVDFVQATLASGRSGLSDSPADITA